MTKITLFEFAPTRSARCHWTLREAGLAFESVGGSPEILGSEDLAAVHPLRKLPAALIDGKPLFESGAISTAIADLVPEKDLIAKPGTWGRCLHDQWTQFALTEMESWLWANFRNTFVLPEEQRISACLEQNIDLYKRSAAVLDAALADIDFLVENRFTVTDIIVGYTANMGRRRGYLDGLSNLNTYLERLFARPHCTLDQS